MSKKGKAGSPVGGSNLGWGVAYVIDDNAPDRLFGTVFNVVEALGLPQKQEESLKTLVRQAIWNVFSDAITIGSERHSEIRSLYYKVRTENSGDVPFGAL